MGRDFSQALSSGEFIFTFELVPGRSVRTRHYQEILNFLKASQSQRLFQAFSITDNAGGNPALSPIPLGKTIKDFGLEPIIHFSCKDKNRNQLESELLALDREGLHNLLVLTGDYPLYGFLGRAKPVYDLDSVLLLKLISEMEIGFEGRPAIPFFKGAVVNPFKLTHSEIWWQYLKLYKKLKAGASFIITQVGFFPKKWLELKSLLSGGLTRILSNFFEDESLHLPEEDEAFRQIPLLGSVLYLTPGILKIIKKGKIPGILLTETVLKRLERASDFEKEVLDLAALFTAILKGLGYRGVHLCGFPLNYEKVLLYFERLSLYEERWEEFLGEFEGRAILEEKALVKKELPCLLKRDFDFSFRGRVSPFYLFNEMMHRLFFSQKSPFFKPLQRMAHLVEKRPLFKRLLSSLEYLLKKLLFNCQECGDCTLWEFNYHCPQSGCAKTLLNGPCGGSLDGFCEVYPFEKRCHFIKAFENSPSKGSLKKFLRPTQSFYLPPRDWELYKSSSWLNFYLKRDHRRVAGNSSH